nr:MAG TPA: YopX protein [Caudoviricetes sp.]DAE55429.1 MAG TPA: YopX protein [Caudoviricetes sp.]
MIPKFRAWDGGSLCRMYQPDEVMVGNGDIWIIDEDSVAGDWIVNNDLDLMQSTGLKDKNGKEIFEGDIVQYQNSKVPSADSKGVIRYFDNWAMFGIDIEYNEPRALFFNGLADHISLEVVGNIYENQELIE